MGAALGQHCFAQGIVRAAFRSLAAVEIEAQPRLDHRVDVEHIQLAAIAHQIQRGGIHRQIDAEALSLAFGQQRAEQALVIVLGHRLLDKAHTGFVEQSTVGIGRVDHHQTRAVEFEMAFDQRQRTASDRAEADHHNRSINGGVNGMCSHHQVLLKRKSKARGGSAAQNFCHIGVAGALRTDGAGRTMPADEGETVIERQQLVADRRHQRGMVAAFEIGASDRAAE